MNTHELLQEIYEKLREMPALLKPYASKMKAEDLVAHNGLIVDIGFAAHVLDATARQEAIFSGSCISRS